MYEILPFVTAWMNLENIILSKISQSEKDKWLLFHLYMESSEQNKQNKQKQIHRYRDILKAVRTEAVWRDV